MDFKEIGAKDGRSPEQALGDTLANILAHVQALPTSSTDPLEVLRQYKHALRTKKALYAAAEQDADVLTRRATITQRALDPTAASHNAKRRYDEASAELQGYKDARKKAAEKLRLTPEWRAKFDEVPLGLTQPASGVGWPLSRREFERRQEESKLYSAEQAHVVDILDAARQYCDFLAAPSQMPDATTDDWMHGMLLLGHSSSSLLICPRFYSRHIFLPSG